MAERPNVLLICVDQWRGDCLSIDGHPVVQTPYLDQLASEGVRFAHAYTATPSCIPARAALYTGLTQRSHGRVGYRDGVPWDYPVTIAGEFTRHGYQSAAIGKLHVYPERSQLGFQQVVLHDGFLHFARRGHVGIGRVDDYLPWLRQALGRDADYFDTGVNCNSVVARPWDKPEHVHPTTFIVTQALDFFRRADPRKPFFLYLGFHRPHPPYDPPAWAFEHYLDAEMPEVPVGDWVDLLAPYAQPNRPDCTVGPIAPALLRRARAGYYGHMSHIDQQLNRLFEVMREYGHGDTTYICFVSDHGELMGDHHLFRKSLPYEGSARIPLVLHGPAGSDMQRNCVRDEIVELRDIMPTLLDCAGLPIPATAEGRSVLPLARGESVSWRPYLHGEHTALGQSVQWVTDGHEKYIWWSGLNREQLFALDDDPQERHDLAGVPTASERLGLWRGRLVAGRPVRAVLSKLT